MKKNIPACNLQLEHNKYYEFKLEGIPNHIYTGYRDDEARTVRLISKNGEPYTGRSAFGLLQQLKEVSHAYAKYPNKPIPPINNNEALSLLRRMNDAT